MPLSRLLRCPCKAGLAHEWSLEQYGVLLEIGGGKERMDHYFSSCADREPWASVTGAARWVPGRAARGARADAGAGMAGGLPRCFPGSHPGGGSAGAPENPCAHSLLAPQIRTPARLSSKSCTS